MPVICKGVHVVKKLWKLGFRLNFWHDHTECCKCLFSLPKVLSKMLLKKHYHPGEFWWDESWKTYISASFSLDLYQENVLQSTFQPNCGNFWYFYLAALVPKELKYSSKHFFLFQVPLIKMRIIIDCLFWLHQFLSIFHFNFLHIEFNSQFLFLWPITVLNCGTANANVTECDQYDSFRNAIQ